MSVLQTNIPPITGTKNTNIFAYDKLYIKKNGIISNFVNLINAEYKKVAKYNSNFEEQFISIHCGLIRKEGPWSKSETDILIQVIFNIIKSDWKIYWIKLKSITVHSWTYMQIMV